MLTKKDAAVGTRVKWQSLDETIAPSYGTVAKIDPASGEIFIVYDDGEDGSTFVNSGVSTVYPA